MHPRISTLLAALLAAAVPGARADVIVVDPAGGPGAPLLQAALNAAHTGDILLLRAGDYSGAVPTLAGKGVALVADAGEDVELPGLLASNVPTSSALVLRGLRVAPPQATTTAADFSLGGSGVLWVEDCEAQGHDAWVDATGFVLTAAEGLRIQSGSKAAVLARCSVLGGRGLDAGTGPGGEPIGAYPGAVGVLLMGPAVLHDVAATGGRGGDGPPDAFGSNGGAGVSGVPSSPCSIQGGTFQGGDEGDGNPASTSPGAGAAFFLSSVTLRDASFQAGAVHGVGTPAPPISASFTTLTTYPAAARHVVLDSPVREFAAAGVHVAAQPGDLAWLLVTAAPGTLQVPKFQGTYVLDPAHEPLSILLGLVDASGLLDLAAQLPALPPATDGLVLFGQLVVANGGTVLLGTASSVVWISAMY